MGERRTIKLYRAVCMEELQQLRATGRFQAAEGTLRGKWFAETIEAARSWGAWFSAASDRPSPYIIEIEVASELADTFFRRDDLDERGTAWYADLHQLVGVTVREVES